MYQVVISLPVASNTAVAAAASEEGAPAAEVVVLVEADIAAGPQALRLIPGPRPAASATLRLPPRALSASGIVWTALLLEEKLAADRGNPC